MVYCVTVVSKEDMYIDEIINQFASREHKKSLERIVESRYEDDFVEEMEEWMGCDFGWDEVDADDFSRFFMSQCCKDLIEKYTAMLNDEE